MDVTIYLQEEKKAAKENDNTNLSKKLNLNVAFQNRMQNASHAATVNKTRREKGETKS